jgi:arabinan endo-1,5-alpha-L-arabinosidase
VQCLLFLSLILSSVALAAPVIKSDFPDPTVRLDRDGFYYAYATGQEDGLQTTRFLISKSRDLTHWSKPIEALPEKPIWARTKINFWAPDVFEKEGTYFLFYSAQPDWSAREGLRLGVATSRTPLGPFIDSGSPLDTGSAEENIDPMVFQDPKSKRLYLYWGRNGEIVVQELSDDLLKLKGSFKPLVKPSSGPFQAVTEGPYVIYRAPYYYLFYSGDDCCSSNPHYAVSVARSLSPVGPFEKNPKVLLSSHSRWIAGGHNSVFTTKTGETKIAFHAVDKEHREVEGATRVHRMLFIESMAFENGWPVVRWQP